MQVSFYVGLGVGN